MKFEWDDNKERINFQKHGITFKEAATVFEDERGILFDDPDHSKDEERFILIGLSKNLKVLVVCHCYRKDADVIRVISARKATRTESKQYKELNK